MPIHSSQCQTLQKEHRESVIDSIWSTFRSAALLCVFATSISSIVNSQPTEESIRELKGVVNRHLGASSLSQHDLSNDTLYGLYPGRQIHSAWQDSQGNTYAIGALYPQKENDSLVFGYDTLAYCEDYGCEFDIFGLSPIRFMTRINADGSLAWIRSDSAYYFNFLPFDTLIFWSEDEIIVGWDASDSMDVFGDVIKNDGVVHFITYSTTTGETVGKRSFSTRPSAAHLDQNSNSILLWFDLNFSPLVAFDEFSSDTLIVSRDASAYDTVSLCYDTVTYSFPYQLPYWRPPIYGALVALTTDLSVERVTGTSVNSVTDIRPLENGNFICLGSLQNWNNFKIDSVRSCEIDSICRTVLCSEADSMYCHMVEQACASIVAPRIGWSGKSFLLQDQFSDIWGDPIENHSFDSLYHDIQGSYLFTIGQTGELQSISAKLPPILSYFGFYNPYKLTISGDEMFLYGMFNDSLDLGAKKLLTHPGYTVSFFYARFDLNGDLIDARTLASAETQGNQASFWGSDGDAGGSFFATIPFEGRVLLDDGSESEGQLTSPTDKALFIEFNDQGEILWYATSNEMEAGLYPETADSQRTVSNIRSNEYSQLNTCWAGFSPLGKRRVILDAGLDKVAAEGVWVDNPGLCAVTFDEIVISLNICDMSGTESDVPALRGIELWGPGVTNNCDDKPVLFQSIALPHIVSDEAGLIIRNYTVHFSADELRKTTKDITQAYLLDQDGKPFSKMSFFYPQADLNKEIKKEALLLVHRFFAPYQAIPQDRNTSSSPHWRYPDYYRYDLDWDGLTDPPKCELNLLYQTTMFLPPGDQTGSRRFRNVDVQKNNVLFVHGANGTDPYWGPKENNWLLGYPGRLDSLLRHQNTPMNVYEYYYPPDQRWIWSGDLFAWDLLFIPIGIFGSPFPMLTSTTIVAHSMGGLVARSALEGKSYNWVALPGGADSVSFSSGFPFHGFVSKLIMLGTPNNGASFSNRGYWDIKFGNLFAPKGGFDRQAPALRELELGGLDMVRLNDVPTLNKGAVEYSLLTGTDWRGQIPNWLKDVVVESSKNSDGAVSMSSASLEAFGVPLHVMCEFSHVFLRDPEVNREGRSLSEAEKNLVPKFIVNRMNNQNTETWECSPTQYYNNIALPIAGFKYPNGTPWQPVDQSIQGGYRFRALEHSKEAHLPNGSPSRVTLVFEAFGSSFNYNDRGQFLYYAHNNFSPWNDREELDHVNPNFYGFRGEGVRNPLSPNGNADIFGKGSGWDLSGFTSVAPRLSLGVRILGLNCAARLRIQEFDLDYELSLNARRTTYHTNIVVPKPIFDVLEQGHLSDFRNCENINPVAVGEGKTTKSAVAEILVDQYVKQLVCVVDDSSGVAASYLLSDPDGITVDSALLASVPGSGFYRQSDGNLVIYSIANPKQGIWNLTESAMTAASIQVAAPTVLCGFKSDVRTELTIDGTSLAMGNDSLVVKAIVFTDGLSFDSLSLTGNLFVDGENAGTVFFRDDGYSPDEIAGDKIFSSSVPLVSQTDQTVSAQLLGFFGDQIINRTALVSIPSDSMGIPTEVPGEQPDLLPAGFSLRQNYPNPFNPSTQIEYELPTKSHVTVSVFNLLGQKVRILVNQVESAGSHKIEWDGRDEAGNRTATGMYLYRIEAGDFKQTKKMILLK